MSEGLKRTAKYLTVGFLVGISAYFLTVDKVKLIVVVMIGLIASIVFAIMI